MVVCILCGTWQFSNVLKNHYYHYQLLPKDYRHFEDRPHPLVLNPPPFQTELLLHKYTVSWKLWKRVWSLKSEARVLVTGEEGDGKVTSAQEHWQTLLSFLTCPLGLDSRSLIDHLDKSPLDSIAIDLMGPQHEGADGLGRGEWSSKCLANLPRVSTTCLQAK